MNPLPQGGMAPFASTREQSIADSVKSTEQFQKAFPNIDWKGAVIEPTVNMAFDLKEKLDPVTREKHEYLFGQIFEHFDESNKTEKLFWEARECLVGYPDVLKQFDAIYIRDDRPVSVMLEQLREALKLKAAMVEKIGSDSSSRVAAGTSVSQNKEAVQFGTGDSSNV
ncbi:hypothetical protein DL766_001006 [Monosporascus sp. MC13-8B]|uniref:Uncharacterized protein n=1 Tax=Monosporascus cannonballus TaxID=155416 RepID=A0ABY0GUG6_9PEZI|nr:hypothetical protein DL762_009358 [Monosporascus cannonballus]RYO89176.1 hypothetical protein DL763_005768 [Monosporascus cannonballus]RYP38297.1 hypothetical protein DL766_001006 [Monosporascus sp. MC13-8B]